MVATQDIFASVQMDIFHVDTYGTNQLQLKQHATRNKNAYTQNLNFAYA